MKNWSISLHRFEHICENTFQLQTEIPCIQAVGSLSIHFRNNLTCAHILHLVRAHATTPIHRGDKKSTHNIQTFRLYSASMCNEWDDKWQVGKSSYAVRTIHWPYNETSGPTISIFNCEFVFCCEASLLYSRMRGNFVKSVEVEKIIPSTFHFSRQYLRELRNSIISERSDQFIVQWVRWKFAKSWLFFFLIAFGENNNSLMCVCVCVSSRARECMRVCIGMLVWAMIILHRWHSLGP